VEKKQRDLAQRQERNIIVVVVNPKVLRHTSREIPNKNNSADRKKAQGEYSLEMGAAKSPENE